MSGIYLFENKTKSSIDVTRIMRTLKFDLQTMFYMVAFQQWAEERYTYQLEDRDRDVAEQTAARGYELLGVRYNVIRRPAHKSVESALKKFHEDRKDGRVGEWFARFRCEIGPKDVEKFRRECLDPILEQMCDWWSAMVDENTAVLGPWGGTLHWRHPFGIYNPMDEGGFSDVDAYLESGSEAGLQRVNNLFPEL